MMQLCVCKEGGRRNRGGNRSRSLGHQPAVEPAILPPTAPSSLTLFLHPSMPFVSPVRCYLLANLTSLLAIGDSRASVAFKFFKQCQLACTVALIILPVSLLTMFTVPCTTVIYFKSYAIPYFSPLLSSPRICLLRATRVFRNLTIFADYDVNCLIMLCTL